MSDFPPRRILVPTDFSDRSHHAVEYATNLATKVGARVLVLHVAPDVPAIVSPLPESTAMQAWAFTEQLKARRAAAEERMNKELAPYFAEVEFELLFEEGEPAATIASVAETRGCDLVVMSSHGRTGLKRALLGSVAERAVRLAHCPVLVVR